MKGSETLSFSYNQIKSFIKINHFKFYLWVGLGYFSIYFIGILVNYYDTLGVRLLNELWRTFYIVVLNFLFFELAMSFIMRKRKYYLYNIVLFLFILWVQLMFCSFGLFAWRNIGIQLHIYTNLATDTDSSQILINQASYGVPSLFFFGIIKHIYDYRKLIVTAQKLKIEKQESELNYLKSQTNPHFLFNTLNNIYSLARDKSDLAPESILRLSEILRFMLYKTGNAYIKIEEELKIISDYIALEKLRYDDTLSVSFKYEIENMKQPIPPLLLIPLVENSFKHGVSETRNLPFVEITLTTDQTRLLFIVKNSTEKFSGERAVKENIGLSNLRRQLELLYKDYSLSVQQDETAFTAILKIYLASHV
jgi:two-component system, LytTR family, sensor kinase